MFIWKLSNWRDFPEFGREKSPRKKSPSTHVWIPQTKPLGNSLESSERKFLQKYSENDKKRKCKGNKWETKEQRQIFYTWDKRFFTNETSLFPSSNLLESGGNRSGETSPFSPSPLKHLTSPKIAAIHPREPIYIKSLVRGGYGKASPSSFGKAYRRRECGPCGAAVKERAAELERRRAGRRVIWFDCCCVSASPLRTCLLFTCRLPVSLCH
jgi:hypothetical protein